MIYQDVKWIRAYGTKLAPSLRKRVFSWYRPARFTPCFLNNAYTTLIQKWRKIPVIVRIDPENFHAMSLQSLSESTGCKITKDLNILGAFATKVNMPALRKLAENKSVIRIWYDEEVRAVLDNATPTVHAKAGWDAGITGKNITIAVLDTGVYNHPDLAGRIVHFQDYVKNKTAPYDDNGHGTHVAGCAAGNGNSSNGLYTGPAPSANIIGIKVLNKTGSGSLSTVIQGVQWCIENKERFHIKIINLSLGSESTQSFEDDPVCLAVEKAWDENIVVCAAAGNSGSEPRTVNSPGNHPRILTVGAADDINTTDRSDDTVASFSSRGPTIDGFVKPDIVAPGVGIIALRSPGSFIDKQLKDARVDNLYFTLSGTSMATPVCAGVIALLLEKDSSLTPDEVKTTLRVTAQLLPGYGGNDQGNGLLDAAKALQSLDK